LLRIAAGTVGAVRGVRQWLRPGTAEGCVARSKVVNAAHREHPQSGISGPFGPAFRLPEGPMHERNCGCFLAIRAWTPQE
jgi:hypothetical protein